MATIALTDATIWVHGYDFTGDLNQITLGATAEQLDVTTFGSGGYRTRIGGLKDVQAQLAGFWSSATSAAPDPQTFPDLGTIDRVVTVAPTSTETSVAYMFQAGKFTTQMFGNVGDAVPYSVDMQGTNKMGLVRGRVLKAKANVTTTGATGTAFQLGAVGASQFLYGTFHVFSAGTTITAVLESDDNAGFTSATTRATFGPIATTGGTWATRVAGAITDDYYRLRISAVTGTFQIAAAVGIGS